MTKLKNLKLTLIAGISMMALSPKAEAGNLQCMPAVTDFVLKNFSAARDSTGIIVQDSKNDYAVTNIGTLVDEDSVEITDINKDAYRVNIHLYSIDNVIVNKTLRTIVHGINYADCSFDTTQEVVYVMYEKRN